MNTNQISHSTLEILARNFYLRSTVFATFIANCIGNVYAIGKLASRQLADAVPGEVPQYEYLVTLPSPYLLSAFPAQGMQHIASSSARNSADSACE